MSQTKAKRKREERRGPPKPVPPPVDLDFTDEDEEQEPERKIELFTYKETKYFMVEPDATLMLKMLRASRNSGELGAAGMLLEELIGTDAYDVLMGIPNLSTKELNGIIERVMHFAMGKMDETLGESSAG